MTTAAQPAAKAPNFARTAQQGNGHSNGQHSDGQVRHRNRPAARGHGGLGLHPSALRTILSDEAQAMTAKRAHRAHEVIEVQQAAAWSFTHALLEANMRVLREVTRLSNPFGVLAQVLQTATSAYAQVAEHGNALTTQATQSTAHLYASGESWLDNLTPANPDDTAQKAAQSMRDQDTTILPVMQDEQLVGIVTGHDLVTRLVAEKRDPVETRVRDVMTQDMPQALAQHA